jgi:hypothetical protein
MQGLPRDKRGYPIPSNIIRDDDGEPLFTVNDEAMRSLQLREDRCPICDQRIIGGRWLVGGPRSAFDPRGAYIDIPMHDECAHYALQVCPYLAAPSYGREIARTQLAQRKVSGVLAIIDNTQTPGRPDGDIFVAVLCRTHSLIRGGQYVRPDRPYMRVEYWKHGQRLPDEEGAAFCRSIGLEV